MRPASASTLTSPSVEDATLPLLTSSSTRLSTPPHEPSRSPSTLCSLATPGGSTSDTTTVTPAAASARAVELPMPIGLPHPVISATRAELGIGPSFLQAASRREERVRSRTASAHTIAKIHADFSRLREPQHRHQLRGVQWRKSRRSLPFC